ncbi:MAG TPA: rod shape-determining protein MreD [Thermoanaerobaculia bacterium]|nr:rod shape-determining protein MreD [Thermoanaerobaculia bacterium]
MRWLRFLVGLLIALTIHSLLDGFFPNALAFFSPYVILVAYYAMGGNLFGAIVAGVIAGLVEDAFSNAIFGLHAFSLTVVGYLVAYVTSRLVLRGTLAFGLALAGSVIVSEIVIYILVTILTSRPIEMFEEGMLIKTLITSLFGMLIYQLLVLFLHEEPLDAVRRPATR